MKRRRAKLPTHRRQQMVSSVGEASPVGEGEIVAEEEEIVPEEEEIAPEEEEIAPDEGCEVVADEEEADSENEQDDENDGNHLDVEEEGVEDISMLFGDARNEEGESDDDSGDDPWDDARIPEPLSSDDETEPTVRKNPEPDGLLFLGKTFGCADDFKLALLRYSLKTRYDIKLYKSSRMRLGAKCTDSEVACPWRVYCSYEKKKRKMQIKVYVNEHICVRSGYSRMLKRSAIAGLFSERLRLNPKLTKQEMAAEIKRDYGLIVTEDACGKAKSKILRERKASHEAHFARIWDYQAEIFQSNPGSTMEIETIPGPTIGSKQRFYRLYVCFEAQKTAWKGTCRPIIGFDGAFLKWDVKGHLLAAVGRDGDNRIVPIAWAVVEIENDTNWDWFVRLVTLDLELNDGAYVTVISDKQKGLVKAVHNVLPAAEHRMCCRHIMDNWKKDNHDMELQRLFWRIARSYTHGDYLENMEALCNYNPGAYLSLQSTNPPSWSRAYFREGSFCNDILNNLCESFNRTIREARRKPLLDLLEDIRRQCMVRNAKRSILAARLKTRFTRRTHIEIEKMQEECKACVRYMATGNFNEVEHLGVNYTVNMSEQTCGCRKWQMTGIPCIHATCVITAKKLRMDHYVSDFYTTRLWRETYKSGIRPVQGMKLWPRTNRLPVLPPPWRPGNPGRPSNYARRRGANESASSSNKTKLTRVFRVMTCSNCKEEGHNKTSCSKPFVESQPKRPRGRPRKTQVCFSVILCYGFSVITQGGLSHEGSSQGPQGLGSQGLESQGQGSQGGLWLL